MSPSTVLRPIARLGAALPVLPWYGWAGIGVGLVALIAGTSKAAAAASSDAGEAPDRPPGPRPLLKLGSDGPWVVLLQWLLSVPQTGHFDETTDEAVRAFQAREGLTVDGKVGAGTWGALGIDHDPEVNETPGPGPGDPAPTPKPAPGPAPSPAPGPVVDPFDLSPSIGTREGQILSAVQAGHIDHDWVPISWSACGHQATVQVSRRALALAHNGQRVIVSVSFKLAQQIADLAGATLLTTRVADEIHKQAQAKLSPQFQPWDQDGSMSQTKRMLQYSGLIDGQLSGASALGLVSNEGKDWVLSRRFFLPPAGTGVEKPQGQKGSRHNSANFGWYGGAAAGSSSPGGLKVIQSIGLTHDRAHVDYSQLLRLMKDPIIVDGQTRTIADVLADPAVSCVLQDEGGVIPAPRHPDL
jgi:hypothetical protein